MSEYLRHVVSMVGDCDHPHDKGQLDKLLTAASTRYAYRITIESWDRVEILTHGTVEEEMLANHHFKCTGCGKLHASYTGTVCPCGEPFPYDHKHNVCR